MLKAKKMQEDQSFLGLTLSILFHIALVLLVWFMPKLNLFPPKEAPTEITILEPSKENPYFVKDLDVPKKDLLQELKDKAKFVSQFNRRVKEQSVAKRVGRTQNSPNDAPAIVDQPQQQQGQRHQDGRARAGGMAQAPRPDVHSSMKGLQPKPQNQGLGPPGGQEGFGKNVMMGPSAIDEFIPGIRGGSMTVLNTDQFTYYTFYARLREQLYPRWVNLLRNYINSLSNDELARLSSTERYTQVEVVLDHDGTYLKGFIHHSSGDNGLDMAGIDAFQSAGSFPNPPKGLVEDDGFVHIHFGFVVLLQPRTGLGAN